MNKGVEGVIYSDLKNPVKDRFPKIVLVIVLAEFCERFSYSGLKAFLTLYLRSKLGFSDNGATEAYHLFTTFVYVFPIIGGVLADNYLGKFRTILYMMFVYAAGNILVALTAVPQLELPRRLCTFIGLFMITVGTGGIKPCVTAFGGDQFKLPEQEHHLVIYFSTLYFVLCVGSLISKTVSPILRSEVHCFGDKDCYSLAFGAPGLVVLAAIIIFVSAKSSYVMKKPEGNVIVEFVKCVSLGIKNVVLNGRRHEKYSHWLDSTQHAYDKKFIKDIKKTLSILMIFTVLPVFWALLDQMGSRWTLQATKMDGRFGFVSVKPDQMQVLAPIFILVLIPLSQKYIYPFLEARNLFKNPLHKLTLGGAMAALSFIAAGLVEIYIKTTYPELPQPGYSQLRIFNGNPCSVSIQNDVDGITYTIPALSRYVKKDVKVQGSVNVTFQLGGECITFKEEMFLLDENQAVSFFLSEDAVYRYYDDVDKSKSGFPIVRFLVSKEIQVKNISLYNEERNEIELIVDPGVSEQIETFASTYSLRIGDKIVSGEIVLDSGGVYAVLLGTNGTDYKSKLIVLTEANSITMALLLPQFLIMSIGEVLFAVTGNEFAFKESPESMKAVMTAVWLLTEAAGNVIIIIMTRLFVNYPQEIHFFIYTFLMCVALVVFHLMSKNYSHGHEDISPKRECRSNSEVLYLQVKHAEDCLEH